MSDKLFRDEAINRIKSPDELNEYIKVANPGIWIGLLAIIVFLVGGLFWCVFANLETKEDTVVVVSDENAICYLDENCQKYVNEGMFLRMDGEKYPLGEHLKEMEKLSEGDEEDEKLLHVMNKTEDGWYYIYNIENLELAPGQYEGTIVFDSVNPISFLTNGK